MYSRLAATLAAGVLAITGLATGTAHAATTPTVSADVKCGRVTLTVPVEPQTPPSEGSETPTPSTSPAVVHLTYQVDGRWPQSIPINPATATVKVIPFRKDSGRHWVRYRLTGSEWSDRIWVESNCRSNWVRADEPTVVQPECDATRGKLVIPADRGVTYKASRDAGRYLTLKAGTYDVRPAVYRVRAYALPGYRLVGDTRWTLTVEPAKPCPTPTPTPTVTVEPTPTATPTPDPTDPDATEEPEPEPVPTVTTTTTQTIVVRNYLPTRVDTGFGGTAK